MKRCHVLNLELAKYAILYYEAAFVLNFHMKCQADYDNHSRFFYELCNLNKVREEV